MNQGFSYLFQLYQKAIEMKNQEQMRLVEGRFSWLINVFTSMMNLGFAPMHISEDEEQQLAQSGENEAHLVLKVIELVKLSSDLSKSEQYRALEVFELSILKFLVSVRRAILTDHRVIAKVFPDPDDSDPISLSGEAFIRVIDTFSSEDIMNLVDVIFSKIMINICMDDQSTVVIEQCLNLMKLLVDGQNSF